MALEVLASLPRRARCWPPGPGRRRWSRGWPGCGPRRPAHPRRPGGLGPDRGGRARRDRARRAVHRPAGRCSPATRPGRPPRSRPLLPEPVDHVLLQADLTAVAPGPLESGLARRLQLVADVESRGGATVYRFTPGSVRRAFDAGWSAAEVHDFIASVSRTPVPQPLTYLVDDIVPHLRHRAGRARRGVPARRRRGRADRAAAPPARPPPSGCAGSPRRCWSARTPLDVLLPRLRELGAAPVVEAADGTVHVARPDLLRARTPRGPAHPGLRAPPGRPPTSPPCVTAIRAGDRATAARPAAPATAGSRRPSRWPLLREAVEAGATVLIGYVDNHGTLTERIVDPVAVEGGQLHRLRPPQRRHPHLRRAPDHRRPHGRLRRVSSPPLDPTSGVVDFVRYAEAAAALVNADLSRRAGAAGAPRRPGVAARPGAPTGTRPLLRRLQRELRPVFEAGDGGRRPGRSWTGLNELLERHPITPGHLRPRARRPAHPRRHQGRLGRRRCSSRESLLGLTILVCDLGPTRLGVCSASPVHPRLRRHLPQPVAPLLLRPVLLAGQRRRLPRRRQQRLTARPPAHVPGRHPDEPASTLSVTSRLP